MKTSIISFVIMILFFISTVYGQKEETKTYEKLYKHSFGVGAGFTTGLGLSYRYFPKKYGFQLNVAPYYENYGKDAFVSGGLTILCNLSENRNNCVYAYLGNHYLYYSLREYKTDYVWDPITQQYIYSTSEHTNKRTELNTGLGFGFEFNTKKRVTLNIMAGYAQYNSFEKLFFTGELALYYRFNMK